jgi:hypothetical protein
MTHLTLLVRKVNTSVIPQDEKIKQIEINFDKLAFEFESKKIEQHDYIISCLGTTKSQAGGKENYRRVEVEYPNNFARMCKNLGSKYAVLMSSEGANAGSMMSYLSQKGQVEDEWKKLDFENLTILRPGVLDRGVQTTFMEKMMGKMMTPMKTETIGKAVMHRVRYVIRHQLKEVKEVYFRNGELNKWSEAMPKEQLEANSSGVGLM